MSKLQSVVAAAMFGALMSATEFAEAQQVAVAAQPPQQAVVVQPERDGVRFRGGIQLEAGALVPPHVALGSIGPQGQIGVQINNLIGVYAEPGFNILFGSAGGASFDFAIMADVTLLENRLMLGGGLDTGAFAAFGTSALAAGGVYGLRTHAAYNLFVSKGSDGIRRKALFVGFDMRFLSGPAAGADVSDCSSGLGASCGASESSHAFVFSAYGLIGYQAF